MSLKPPPSADDLDPSLRRRETEVGSFRPWVLKLKGGDLAAVELRVLECLGAAVVSEWENLPTSIQKILFKQATTKSVYDPALLKTHIARFLHDHKGAADLS